MLSSIYDYLHTEHIPDTAATNRGAAENDHQQGLSGLLNLPGTRKRTLNTYKRNTVAVSRLG